MLTSFAVVVMAASSHFPHEMKRRQSRDLKTFFTAQSSIENQGNCDKKDVQRFAWDLQGKESGYHPENKNGGQTVDWSWPSLARWIRGPAPLRALNRGKPNPDLMPRRKQTRRYRVIG